MSTMLVIGMRSFLMSVNNWDHQIKTHKRLDLRGFKLILINDIDYLL